MNVDRFMARLGGPVLIAATAAFILIAGLVTA